MHVSIFVAVLAIASFGHTAIHELLVGSFANQVIYTLVFDDQTYSLDLEGSNVVSAAPSWLAFNHDKTALYGTAFNVTPSQYHSFQVNNATDIVHTATISGFNCTGSSIFVTALPRPPYTVYGTFYYVNAGCIAVMKVDDQGTLLATEQQVKLWPTSGVHGTAFHPDRPVIYSADTEGNALWTHQIDSTTGQLTAPPGPEPLVVKPASSGPRHLAVHPSGKLLYVIDEEANLLQVYRIPDDSSGAPVALANASYSVLGDGENPAAYWADEVQLSPSAKYLWASSRAHNASTEGWLALFSLDRAGIIVRREYLNRTQTSGGLANAVAPAPWTDEFVALTDSQVGSVSIWRMRETGSNGRVAVEVVADLGIQDRGCCGNVVWYS